MKRRFFVILFAVVAFTCLALGLAACSGGNSPSGGAHSHDMEHYSAVEATCTESGNIEYWYCEDCGKYFSDAEGNYEVTDITVAAKGHTWGEWEVTKQATCEETGSQTRTCSVCKETETEEIPLAEHSYGEWQVTEKATCTEDGEQKHTCEVCGHEETETLSALGHTWGDWQIVEEATCKDGLRKHVCETCGAEEEEIIPASGEHKYIDTVIPPTVDEPGYTLHKCEICGEEYKDTYVDITFTEGLAYQLSADKEYYILTGIGDAIDTYLYLPASVNNKPVKEIAAKAFKDNTEITGVYIGSGVEVIGDSAFDGCTSLKDITLFDSIKEIGVGAFDDTAYYNNRDNWENSALYIGSCLIDVRETALGTLDIKDGTHIIGAAAVADCVNILEVNIPDTVRYINRQAFAGCNTLEEVTVPSNVETMGVNAFYGCTSLKKLTIPFIGETAEDTTSPFGYLFGTVNDMTNFEAVPQSLTEVIVTGGETVADSAFYGLEKLTKIVLPETIKIIGEQAFSGCSNLVNFVIPANVESIGTEAFKDCAALTSVAVPENVTSIGLGAFGGCGKLESITMPFVGQNLDGTGETHFGYIFGAQSYSDNKNTVPESLKKVEITKAESIGNYAFSGCSGLTSIVIPDSVTRIGSSAFSNCVSLTSITIPASVTRIGEEVFYNCRSLTSITIPEGVTNVGKRAFINCISLTSITIPDSVVSIEIDVFEFCSSIESIYFQGDITDWLNIDFEGSNSNPLFNGAKLYLNNELVTELIIPDGVTEIKPHAFEGCNSLTSVTIPGSVTSIEEYAFYNCSGLTSIVIPDSVTSIGEHVFLGCDALESIYYQGDIASWCGISGLDNLSKSKVYIGNQKLQEITSIEIPDGVTQIRSFAFSGCSALTSIVIPDSVTSIGERAFFGCYALESITLPFVGEKADSSGSMHFGYIFGASSYSDNDDYVPESLKEVVITGGKSIGDFAFYNCDSLASVTLDNSVTSIGSSAFYNCSSLTSIVIPDSVTSIGSSAFYNCSSLTSIVIPDSVTSIGSSAFYNCSSLTSIVIPDSVTSIGERAFNRCDSLTIYCETDSKPSAWANDWDWSGSSYSNLPVIWDCYKNDIADDGYKYSVIDGIRYQLKDGFAAIVGQPTNISGNIVIPESVTYKDIVYSVASIGDGAFGGCSRLASIVIPDSVTSIGNSAFSGCSRLTSIVIPDSVTSIEEYAFYNCSGLTSIVIPDSVTSIGSSAFNGCSNVIQKENGISYVDNWVIGCDTSVTNVVLREDTVGIVEYAFSDCSRLTSIVIPDSVTSIGDYAFYECYSLARITISNGVTSIGNYVFYSCRSLVSVTIPDGVTSIGQFAFNECFSLESVTIPDSVTSISDYAFNACGSGIIYYGGTESNWAEISIGINNGSITAAPRYYYSETQPTEDGNFWHYDDDGITPIIWTKESVKA